MKAARGLTLVELVLTMAIMLTLTAVAIGGYTSIGAWRAASAVRRVHADVQHARGLAMTSACRTALTIDTTQQEYTLGKEEQPATGSLAVLPLDHPLNGGGWVVALGALASGFRITNVSGLSGSVLGFGIDGLPVRANGSRMTETVRIEFSNGAAIEVDPGSGRSEVQWP